MFKKIKKLLEDIQNSDETTKKRWLIGASVVSMFLVIGLWLVYIKSTLEFSGKSVENQESNVGFWQIFKNGLTIAIQSIKEGVKGIVSEITKGKIIIIE